MATTDGTDCVPVIYDNGQTTVLEWMWDPKGLGLTFGRHEAPLMVYARIYQICRNGGIYLEDPDNAGRCLGYSGKTVARALKFLERLGYICHANVEITSDGVRGRRRVVATGKHGQTANATCAWRINIAAASDAITRCRPFSDLDGLGSYYDTSYVGVGDRGRRSR